MFHRTERSSNRGVRTGSTDECIKRSTFGWPNRIVEGKHASSLLSQSTERKTAYPGKSCLLVNVVSADVERHDARSLDVEYGSEVARYLDREHGASGTRGEFLIICVRREASKGSFLKTLNVAFAAAWSAGFSFPNAFRNSGVVRNSLYLGTLFAELGV